ncbi:MAG: hypothetical protein IBJ03_11945 [Gemmatimonadaceae bacterium]|nr:hypothetical protein [Gemmatimonadaceae bacterium]
MKRLALVALVLVMACGSDKDSPTGPNGSGSVTAMIDGAAFSADLAVQATRSGNLLSFGAVTSTSRQINFALPNVTGTGTVQLGGGAPATVTYTEGTRGWVTSLVGGSGSVNITTLTANRAAGTFSFTAIPSASTGATGNKVVTNGTFDVKF